MINSRGGPVVTLDSSRQVSCFGGMDAALYVSVSGGTKPLRFQWRPSGDTTEDAQGLSSGMHTLQVTDSAGCAVIFSDSLSQPPPLSLVLSSQVDVKCHKGSDGSASVNASGGTGSYRYRWSDGTNGPLVSRLSSGMYKAYVRDMNNCEDSLDVVISQPDSAIFSVSIVPSNVMEIARGK